jgi:predicted nucleotidyltransferase component of viral defense system
MNISRERLLAEAEATGFRAEILEKVFHLFGLLEAFRSHPFLKDRLVLKGGTALNLFFFDLPRLSVDIDLNYIGAVDREIMLTERPKVEQAILDVSSREGFTIRRMPTEHAGGKWLLQYGSELGQSGNLAVDVNFMFRIPLWTVKGLDSRQVGSYQIKDIQVLNIHELAAGKLAALLARCQARDLFDVHQLLPHTELQPELLRLGFVVYGAMNRRDWRTVSPGEVDFEARKLERQLLPLLRVDFSWDEFQAGEYGSQLVEDCREKLGAVLPFSEPEMEFLDRLLDEGVIKPSLLTPDKDLQERIGHHPLLEWKALNVRKHKGN